MISAIFNTIGQAISSFTTAIANVFSGLQDLFVVTNEGTTTMTFLGTLLLIGAGVGVVYWAFRMIKSLVKRA